jgi:hypothetical protein
VRFLNLAKRLAIVAMAVTAGACSTPRAGVENVVKAALTPEAMVTQRAQARWDALMMRQFDKAFDFITPAGRSTLPREVFSGRLAGASWLGAKVTKVTCEPEVCDVSVELEYYLLPNYRHKETFAEKWILDGDNWWFVYRG